MTTNRTIMTPNQNGQAITIEPFSGMLQTLCTRPTLCHKNIEKKRKLNKLKKFQLKKNGKILKFNMDFKGLKVSNY